MDELIVIKNTQMPNFCSLCQQEMVRIDTYYVCESCGDTKEWIFFESKDIVWKKFPYTRLNYFKYKLNKIRCKDNDYIPKHIYDKLRGKTYNNIWDLRKEMKSHKMGKYYKNMYTLFYKFTGKYAVNLDYELRNKLITGFKQIESTYFKYENNRVQFCNYNYLIFKLCFILGRIDVASQLTFINRYDKTIRNYDRTFELICNDLGWPFTTTKEELDLVKHYVLDN
jgi:hypothetical protein